MLPQTGLDVVRTEQALPELSWGWGRASVTNAEPGFTLSISRSDNQGQGRGHRDRQKARERTKLKISWRPTTQHGKTATGETELEKSRAELWAVLGLNCSCPSMSVCKQEPEGGDPLSPQQKR